MLATVDDFVEVPAAWKKVHSCQLSRNLWDSPEFLTCVPEGSRKTALAQIVPEKLWKNFDCPEITTGVATPTQVTISVLSTKHFLGATYCG